MMERDQLERYRRAIDHDGTGAEIESLVSTVRKAGYEVTGHDVLKTAPKGYAKDHPRLDLLRNKGLIAWKQWEPGAWLGKAPAKNRVVTFLRATRPLAGWLDQNVGASELIRRG
jgi:uncharacterized protein (DUF2461 family)